MAISIVLIWPPRGCREEGARERLGRNVIAGRMAENSGNRQLEEILRSEWISGESCFFVLILPT